MFDKAGNLEKAESDLTDLEKKKIVWFNIAALNQLFPNILSKSLKSKNNYLDVLSSADISFNRTIHIDRCLTDSLVVELRKRGVDMSNEGTDHIVLIGEWDSFYGRALPMSFALSIEKYRMKSSKRKKKLIDKRLFPKRIHRLAYMYGIDGILPGDEGDSINPVVDKPDKILQKENRSHKGYYKPEFKQPLGKAQYDYIRRLVKRIRRLPFSGYEETESMTSNYNAEIRAIGVLGGDIYDKLLIFRALRPEYPNAIFFTNDLDARLFHETELKWTRNLIVASSYGLQLHPELQKDIPPFRYSYQSSLFAATLQVLGIRDINLEREKPHNILPRIFEIGRNGPYDLTPFSNLKEDQAVPLHPKHYVQWQSKVFNRGFWLYIFLTVVFPCLMFMVLISIKLKEIKYLVSDLYKKKKQLPALNHNNSLKIKILQMFSKVIKNFNKLTFEGNKQIRVLQMFSKVIENFNKLTFEGIKKERVFWSFVLSIPCLISFIALSSIIYLDFRCGEGEPLTFLDGISIWPAVLIRLFCGVLAIYFILLSNYNFIHSEGVIDNHYSQRNADDISVAWHKYRIKEGGVKKCMGYAVFFALVYLCVVLVVLIIFGWPPVPFRGSLSFYTDSFILGFSLLLMSLLAWFVFNRVYYCRNFFSDIDDSHKDNFVSNNDKSCSIRKIIGKGKCVRKDNDCQKEVSSCLQKYDTNLTEKIQAEYSKIWVIAKRTEAIGKMILYSFIVFAILLISRNQFFDCWTWPIPLIFVIGTSICIGIYYSFILFYSANNIRKQTITRLYQIRLQLMGIQIPSIKKNDRKKMRNEQRLINDDISKLTERKTKYIECMINDIKDLKDGAFTPLGRNHLLIAVLTPLGGIGSLAILPHLIQLFGK
ncbi:Mg2+ and Co2+ transporter [Candidatus Scalindua japonica]|uniref:Mg2+ and Co2+ transporter n=1 Tax=Candidatus Scalindua japonica TaxID=1284222 RepID=A0A286TTZ4_9BACT|nr:hypothetical protein [Candidatus Scalindua japonica]GAX59346.1 Mg2+ and Co2+ transporter [Candidatus Scalindua japonica]